jgi:hypothetical protein
VTRNVRPEEVFDNNFGGDWDRDDDERNSFYRVDNSYGSSAYWLVYIQTIFIKKLMLLSSEYEFAVKDGKDEEKYNDNHFFNSFDQYFLFFFFFFFFFVITKLFTD